jgi:hypothetical protein
MLNSRSKLPIFIFGLIFGVLLGAGAIFWKFSDQNIGLLVQRKMDEATGKLFSSSEIEAVIDEKLKKLESEKRENDVKSQTRTTKRINEKNVVENDPGRNEMSSDSLSKNDLVNEIKEGFRFLAKDSSFRDSALTGVVKDENVIVKKDELISVKTFEAYSLSEDAASTGIKDSLLEKVSGVNQSNSSQYKIEFWRSPLNYKGYKMSKNLIVLFGFFDKDQYQVYRFEDDVFLKHYQNVYHLKNTGDFKPMEKVADESILRALNDLRTEQ